MILNADSYDTRIFFAPTDTVKGLAVNLVDARPNADPGAVNLTQTAGALTQTWSFV